MEVEIGEVSDAVGALALQGPLSRAVLDAVAEQPVDGLKYFRVMQNRIAGVEVQISRTGYTGDLGYELWIPAQGAIAVWDALIGRGADYGITPAGIWALDVVRIEAGLVMLEVDYQSSQHAMIESQKSSPYELSLARAARGSALRGGYAGGDRGDRRAPTQARQRLGAQAPVLRPRAEEGLNVRSSPAPGAQRSYDAIVVGAGHNGLVAAAYLARAGRRVLVLERRPVIGGAAVSEQVFPGFTFSVFSYVVSLLRPEIIRDLELPRHGLQILPLESTIVPLPNGDYLGSWGDADLTR